MPKQNKPIFLKHIGFQTMIRKVHTFGNFDQCSLNLQCLREFYLIWLIYVTVILNCIEIKKKLASTLLEEFLSLLFEDECVKIQSGCADLFFNKGIRKLILSKEDGLLTYKELELLRAASVKCSVRSFIFNISHQLESIWG